MSVMLFAVFRSQAKLSNFSPKINFRNLFTTKSSYSQLSINGFRGISTPRLTPLCLKLSSVGNLWQNPSLSLLYIQVNQFSSGQIFQSQSPLNVNTNVVKDVVLFRYENSKFYNFLSIFAVCQFLFWMYLSSFAYTSLKDTPVNHDNEESLPWWRKINLGENKYRNGLAVVCFVIGYGVLASAWAFTLKSVRFLILRKGGESLTLVTYGPFGRNRMMTVPLSVVSCEQARHAARVHLPIKVKGKYLFYVLDMRGEFTNPHLFDVTAGLKRP